MALTHRNWIIYGTIHNSNGTVFNNQGRILAYHRFPQKGWYWIAESNIDAYTGRFELHFETSNFQESGSPEVEYPTLQIRVTDYQYRPLWMSSVYTNPPTSKNMGDIIVNGSIASNWNVRGNVYDLKNAPYTTGYVKAFDVRNGNERVLNTCQLNANGFYSIDYTKSQFQQGNSSIAYPNLLVRAYTSGDECIGSATGPSSASTQETINIQVNVGQSVVNPEGNPEGNPGEGGNPGTNPETNPETNPGNQDASEGLCRVFGSVENKLGAPVPGVRISAYCLHYDITGEGSNATGAFVHQLLSETAETDESGKYSISYNPQDLPQGLQLDANETFGKEKASLYAKLEIYETDDATEPKTTILKPLVFNGKREQRIDFVLDVSSDVRKHSLFEELDDLLSIYRETVISNSEYLTDCRNKIEDFLKDVDEFPLVVGREHRTEEEVKAYFLAYSLYYGLFGQLEKTDSEDNRKIYAQGLFALTYQEIVANLSDFINAEIPTLQNAIFDGVAKNQIAPSITVDVILDLWREAANSSAVVSEMDDQFSPYHVFCLYITGDLPLKDIYEDDNTTIKTARVDLSRLTSEDEAAIKYWMDKYYEAGSDYREMLAGLENYKKLELLIDLCDFGGWYGDFVVAAYRWTQDVSRGYSELKQLLNLQKEEWEEIATETSRRFERYYPNDPLGLPHNFPGNSKNEQITLYAKKLKDLIDSWFPQQKLYNKLNKLSGEKWTQLLQTLETKEWKDFRLTDHDSKKFEEEHPNAAKITDDKMLEKLHILQRIFRLTDDADAVVYLINSGFESATSIAQLDEDYFVAEHALGIGTKEQATQIHRVAKNFVSEATFKIGQFHGNLNENDQTLKVIPRGVTPNRRNRAPGNGTQNAPAPTNVAPSSAPMAVSPTWKNLFGNINRNGATEGQSVLSASAYFVDLLAFFKANEEPYKRFLNRRPDLVNLNLTKANAEVAMPTIDLVNELLECLAGDDSGFEAQIISNQTPPESTVESLRAEPLKWISNDGENDGENRQVSANLKLMNHAYPAMLPLNTYRTKATKLLGNIPLTFYNVSEALERGTNEKTCLFADELLHEILFKRNSEPWTSWGLKEKKNNVYLPDKSEYKLDDPLKPTPYLKDKNWDDVLGNVAILLDRTGLTFKELKEILSLPIFKKYNVEYRCPDALQYQLADINGYILIDNKTIEYVEGTEKVKSVHSPSEDFFTELAAFIRFRRLLGWNFTDIALRYEELNNGSTDADRPQNNDFQYSDDPLCNWDRIQEMVLRFDITPLNSLAWHGFALTEDELASVFDMSVLFKRYRVPEENEDPQKIETYDNEYIENDIAKAAVNCLSLKKEDVLTFLEHSGIFNEDDAEDESENGTEDESPEEAKEKAYRKVSLQHQKFLDGLNYIYKFGTFAAKHNLTADEFYLLQDAGLGSIKNVREFSRSIRKWQGISLPISVLEDLIRMPDESVKKKAEAFMGVAKTDDDTDAAIETSQKPGTFYTTISESWNSVKVDEKFDIDESEIASWQGDSVEHVAAYKDACSKILVSLGFVDAPFVEQLTQEDFPESDTDAYNSLKKWLVSILGQGADANQEDKAEEILDEGTPLARLFALYHTMIDIWYEKQVYILLSQEFGIGSEDKSQKAFKALLEKLNSYLEDDEKSFYDWLHYAKTGDYWPEDDVSPNEINLSPYYALYKASILYQYVSGYVLNSADVEEGLKLGFEWDYWNGLYNENTSESQESLMEELEKLVEAFAVSDACGNSSYSYAVVPPADEDSLSTPITNLKQLKRQLLIPQSVFKACYDYVFDLNLSDNVDSWEQIEIETWDKPQQWLKFLKVYQLYLKTFTTPDCLENLFIELQKSDLNGTSDNFKKLETAVQTLNDNLNSNYSNSQWYKFIQNISDEIRKERRDALTGFVCWESQDNPSKYPRSFLNANDLYAYYLIDVLMEPDMSMSRIVQANACLQLFVQRCQLGLEGQTDKGENLFSDSSLGQWEWMKNYQVWVANRKVFLYPENWLDVSLRDDKSPFFVELEEHLQEVGGDSDDMERIYAEYLEKMRETANLEIVGCCKEDGDPNGENVYTLHIIGRTRGEPHRYYYRKYFAKKDSEGTWSPWDAIEADITGEIVFPQLMNGRLYLAWPQYTQGQRQLNSGVASLKEEGEDAEKSINVPQLEFYVEIKMAWTCFNGKKWTGVKTTKTPLYDLSHDPLDFQLNEGEQIGDRYHYKTSCNGTSLTFWVSRTLLDIDHPEKAIFDEVDKIINQLKEERAQNRHKGRKNFLKDFGLSYFKSLKKEDFYNRSIAYWENYLKTLKQGNLKKISIDKDSSVNQVVEKRVYCGLSTQKISSLGSITLFADGKDDAQKTLEGDTHIDEIPESKDWGVSVGLFSPLNTYLKHNYWCSNGDQALVYKDREILSAMKEFRILPVNMDFYDPDNELEHVSDLPFFYMDSENTFFVYPKAGNGNARVYKFIQMSHPIMDEFFNQYRNGGKKVLHTRGIEALEKVQSYYTMYSGKNYYFGSAIGYHLAGDTAAWDMGQSFFESNYEPTAAVTKTYPAPYVDFTWKSPNGIYNWELFFYVPIRIADKLISEEKYEAALEWIQLVFDPQGKKEGPERIARWADALPSGAQYWRFLPFYANPDADKTILESLAVLNQSDNAEKKQDMQCLIDQWKFDPFEPHLIAKLRHVAYQKFVVMKYLNTLIARGDELFTVDTTESVNLAIQFYIMAADILGPKSAEAPDPSIDKIKSALEMLAEAGKDGSLDWANTLLEYEDSMLIGRSRDKNTHQNKFPDRTSLISNISKQTFYFNVPRNENLMAFWDTVADRLYKIRNSLNIEGVKRTLALFAPPIDPGMLVRARAAGLSISDILADSGAALPHYRFKVLVAKALEIARDLRNMQETLLQALKDKDSEALAQLRLQHRIAAKKLSQNIFDIQMKELETEASSLEIEKEKKAKTQEHHKSKIEKLKTDFENGYAKTMQKVADLREKVESAKRIASAMYSIPDLDAGGIVNAFGGIDFHVASYGGRKLGEAAITMAESYLSKALEREAAALQQKAKGEEKKESEEEAFEESVATDEIDQTEKSIIVNTIRQEQNEKEQELFEKELERDEEEYEFLCDKFTNKDLHEWLVKQLTKLSKTMCKLTTKVAKMAEKCYHFEIGDVEMGNAKSFIGNSYWDGAYSGLLSADRLIADLHAMEVAYLENDKNELEITRDVDLKEIVVDKGDNQKTTVFNELIDSFNSDTTRDKKFFSTDFYLSRELFSKEFSQPHIFERIRNVQLQVVSTSEEQLSAELNMDRNVLYTPNGVIENRIGVQTSATNSANSDCSKYNFDFRSDKFSPFEGAGIESHWQLIISASKNFVKESITKVILHISYTARNG